MALLAVAPCVLAAAPVQVLELGPFDGRIPAQTSGYLTLGDQVLFFSQAFDTELWATRLSPPSTHRVAHFQGTAKLLGSSGRWAFFEVEDANGLRPDFTVWRTDGTTAGTSRLGLTGAFFSSTPFSAGRLPGGALVSIAANVYRVDDAVGEPQGPLAVGAVAGNGHHACAMTSQEVRCTEGAPATLRTLTPPSGLPSSFHPDTPVAEQGPIFFRGASAGSDAGLFVVDAPATSFSAVTATGLGEVGAMAPWGTGVVLVSSDDAGASLWFSDGTTAGTRALGPLASAQASFGASSALLWVLSGQTDGGSTLLTVDATNTLTVVASGLSSLTSPLRATDAGLFLGCSEGGTPGAVCFVPRGGTAPQLVAREALAEDTALLDGQLVFGPRAPRMSSGGPQTVQVVGATATRRASLEVSLESSRGLLAGPFATDAGLAMLSSDGTAAGTAWATLGTLPFSPPRAGDRCFTVAGHAWVSDGTTAGTRRVPGDAEMAWASCPVPWLMLVGVGMGDAGVVAQKVNSGGSLEAVACGGNGAGSRPPGASEKLGALVPGFEPNGCLFQPDGGVVAPVFSLAALPVGPRWLLDTSAGLDLLDPRTGARQTLLSYGERALASTLVRASAGRAFALATTGSGGLLATTDGTSAGSRVVARWPTPPRRLFVGPGEVVVLEDEPDPTRHLLRSDGVREVRVELPEWYLRTEQVRMRWVGTVALIEGVRFDVDFHRFAYRWDALDAGLTRLPEPPSDLGFESAWVTADGLVLPGNSHDGGTELWTYGTDGNAMLQADLEPGPQPSVPAIIGGHRDALLVVATVGGRDRLFRLPRGTASEDLTSVDFPALETPATAPRAPACGCSTGGLTSVLGLVAWLLGHRRRARPRR